MSSTNWILHVDLDQFLAAVEVRRRPELRGRPLVVGGSGDPTERRKVVMCASYEAREYGVHAGMPLRAALRKCADAVFLPTDYAACEEASAQVMDILRRMPVLVEVLGWDEAFVGARTDDPEALAADIRRTVLAEAGLSCSVGIGDTKQRAKLATGFAKPAGIFRLTESNWMELMGDRPTDALWGVGRRIAARLADLGLATVADLAAADPDRLVGEFGPRMGPWFGQLALGGGDSTIRTAPWVARSRSKVTTFPDDLTDRAEIEARLAGLARDIGREVFETGRSVKRVAVIVRNSSFFTQTRIASLPVPTTEVADVERAALMVLGRFELARPVRLLGVRVDLTDVESS